MVFGMFGGKEKVPTPIEFEDMLEKLDEGLMDALVTLKRGIHTGGYSSDPAGRAMDKKKIADVTQSVEAALQNKKLTLVGADSVEGALTSWIYSDGAVAESAVAQETVDNMPDVHEEASRTTEVLEVPDSTGVEDLIEEESLSDAEIDDLIARITKAANQTERTESTPKSNVVPIRSEEVSPHAPKEGEDLDAFFKKGQDPHNLKGRKDAA